MRGAKIAQGNANTELIILQQSLHNKSYKKYTYRSNGNHSKLTAITPDKSGFKNGGLLTTAK